MRIGCSQGPGRLFCLEGASRLCPGPSPVMTLSPSEGPNLGKGNVFQERKDTFQSVSPCCPWAGLTITGFGYLGGLSPGGGWTRCKIMEVEEQQENLFLEHGSICWTSCMCVHTLRHAHTRAHTHRAAEALFPGVVDVMGLYCSTWAGGWMEWPLAPHSHGGLVSTSGPDVAPGGPKGVSNISLSLHHG